jgi:hypothetical protein
VTDLEFVGTPRGLSTRGAGASLLGDLLNEYEEEIRRLSPSVADSWSAGVPPDEVRGSLAAGGATPDEELVTWWSWHDGYTPGVPRRLRNAQCSLKEALTLFGDDFLALDPAGGDPDEKWLPVARLGGRSPIAVAVDANKDEQLRVRSMDEESGLTTSPDAQVISLCTLVAMWLTAIQSGWEVYDAALGGWVIPDYGAYPLEWRRLGLV